MIYTDMLYMSLPLAAVTPALFGQQASHGSPARSKFADCAATTVSSCLFQVCETEGNAVVARNIVRSWHEVLQTAYDPASVSNMYHRAARVCISNDSRLLAQEICRDMQSRGISVDSQLQELLERNEQPDSDSDEGD